MRARAEWKKGPVNTVFKKMQHISLHSIDNRLLTVRFKCEDKTKPLLEVTGKYFIDNRKSIVI